MNPRDLKLDMRLPAEAGRVLTKIETALDRGIGELLAAAWWNGFATGGIVCALALLVLIVFVLVWRKS